MEKTEPYRQAFEKDGTLHIVVGAVVVIVGLAALINGAAALFALILFAVGVWVMVHGFNLRTKFHRRDAPAKPNPHAEPSATE